MPTSRRIDPDRARQLEATLRDGLQPIHLEVEDESARHAGHAGAAGGGGHYRALIVSETFRGKTHLQRQRDEFIQKRNEEERRAEAEAANQLKAARKRFEDERKRIEADKSLDQRSKEQLLVNIAESEQRRVEVSQTMIEREKRQEIKQIDQRKTRSIRAIEEEARWWAIVVSPLPAVILGLSMMLWLMVSERRTIVPERSVR